MNPNANKISSLMSCSKALTTLDCKCHPPATFTYDELYQMYLVMRTTAAGKDIFGGFLSQLRRVTIEPTHVYRCCDHVTGWVRAGHSVDNNCCGGRSVVKYAGCVNSPSFVFPSYAVKYGGIFKLECLLSYCFDVDNRRIECPKLALYFPKEYSYDPANVHQHTKQYYPWGAAYLINGIL